MTEKTFEKKHKLLWSQYKKAYTKSIKQQQKADLLRDEANKLHVKVWELEAKFANQ